MPGECSSENEKSELIDKSSSLLKSNIKYKYKATIAGMHANTKKKTEIPKLNGFELWSFE